MRHLRKEPKKPLPIIITSVICIALIALLIVLIPKFNISESTEDTAENSESIISAAVSEKETEINKTEELSAEKEPETNTDEPSKPIVRDYVLVELINGEIETPYTVIKYPEGLADNLVIANTSDSPYVLEFYALFENKKEIRLFDISLGENSGGNMGYIKTSKEDIPLNVNIYTLPENESLTENEINTLCAMQDVINDILSEMDIINEEASDNEVLLQQPEDSGTINNVKIETPVCNMYYPSRFSETMYYTCDDKAKDVYKVHFYSKIDETEDKLLFSVYFGGDEGEQLGVVEDKNEAFVPVYLIMNEFNTEGLKDEQLNLLYSMQESSNEIIERLPFIDFGM